MRDLREVPAADVRHLIATVMAEDLGELPPTIGSVVLRPHQRGAARRLLRLLRTSSGAMLSDPVGMGKTYTALAIAAAFDGDVLIVAPASLRAMWADALERCGVRAQFVSHEALSFGSRPAEARLVIVDEAHRFRNPSAKRYAMLADVCRRSSVLLLTATPVQNHSRDLAAQLALFAGRRAWGMSEAELAEFVVRASGDLAGAALPRQRGPLALELTTNDDCLEELLSLPSPVPARNEAIAAALLTFGLIHQWTSSRAALAAALRRRRTRGLALTSALEAGRAPTRAELAAWTHGDDAMQLAFPELVAAEPVAHDMDLDALLIAVDRHSAAIDALLGRFRRTPDPDLERAGVLRQVRASHPGERIIAFCQYAETVNALWSAMRNDAGVAALTASGARVAGGRISRDAVLRQFIPGDAPDVPAAERIDLLVTTDLLSEGLNLQRASVVVHIDLPWNPARLDQRVGRVRRLGSRHEVVTIYSIAPPAPAARLLRIEERLREKLRAAQRTVGVAGQILPSPLGQAVRREAGFAERAGDVHQRIANWRVQAEEQGPVLPVAGATSVAAVASRVSGFVALLRSETTSLVADLGAGVTDSLEVIAAALDHAQGDETRVDPSQLATAVSRLQRYCAAREASSAIDFQLAAAARSRRAALARVAQALERAPRHRRAQLAPLADAARAVATAPLGEGAERILETLIKAELPDEAWLRSIATFSQLNSRPNRPAASGSAAVPQIVAIILLSVSF